MLELRERAELWAFMLDSERGECSDLVSGWFFGEALERLTRADVLDWLAWSMFEGRNPEHLTREESRQVCVEGRSLISSPFIISSIFGF